MKNHLVGASRSATGVPAAGRTSQSMLTLQFMSTAAFLQGLKQMFQQKQTPTQLLDKMGEPPLPGHAAHL